MWKIIDSETLPFAPYPKGIASVKRIVEKEKVGTRRFGGFGLIEVPPGGVFEPHTHPEREEIYYFLSDSGSLIVENDQIPAKKGLTFYVSGEDSHGLKNQGKKPLLIMFVTAYK